MQKIVKCVHEMDQLQNGLLHKSANVLHHFCTFNTDLYRFIYGCSDKTERKQPPNRLMSLTKCYQCPSSRNFTKKIYTIIEFLTNDRRRRKKSKRTRLIH